MPNLAQYGLTTEEWGAVLSSQDNRCAICPRRFTESRRPCVDHNHRTGEVRGALCHRCNRLLGQVNEDDLLLERAALYLQHPPTRDLWDTPRRGPDAPPLEYLEDS